MAGGYDQTTHAPIVRVWWQGAPERAELGRFLEELTSLYKGFSGPRHVLFDFSELGVADSAARRQLASWRAANRSLFDQKIAAAAYVFTSKLTRGYLTAVDWLRPAGGLRKVFGTQEDALDWLRGLARANRHERRPSPRR